MNETKKSAKHNESPTKAVETVRPLESMIYSIRGQQVMLDRDLATLYQIETKVLNQAVKRNLERFPEDFMFQMEHKDKLELWAQTKKELSEHTQYIEIKDVADLRSRIVTSSLQVDENEIIIKKPPLTAGDWGGSRYRAYAFTENGIAMLSSVLKSPKAIEVNIAIMHRRCAKRCALS